MVMEERLQGQGKSLTKKKAELGLAKGEKGGKTLISRKEGVYWKKGEGRDLQPSPGGSLTARKGVTERGGLPRKRGSFSAEG